MKRTKVVFISLLILMLAASGVTRADLPTIDAVNAALNQLRNALMQSQFAQEIAMATEQISQLQSQYLELLRVHSGFDDIFHALVGDSFKNLFRSGNGSLRDAFTDFGWVTSDVEILNQASGPADIRSSLEAITGKIPASHQRPYIPFEEMQVVEGFQLAQEIRGGSEATRDAASSISQQAQTASPKGAARLNAEALSQVMILSQQQQEALAKLIELEAVQVEQVSREEKRLEWERTKYLDDAGGYLSAILEAR